VFLRVPLAEGEEEVICELCNEEILPHHERANSRPLVAHRECSLRSVIGGIGHLMDHAHFCGKMDDPDAGLSYRHSALLVDTWVHVMGVEEAASKGT
jgi:tetrahydromethanopterin S-methyltransferase subunit E